MYRIMTQDGELLGRTEHVNFIKQSDTGDFTTATMQDAEGIAYLGIVYNLSGHDIAPGHDTVSIFEEDSGAVFAPNDEFRAFVNGIVAAYEASNPTYSTSISELEDRIAAQEVFTNAAIGGIE